MLLIGEMDENGNYNFNMLSDVMAGFVNGKTELG